uniref:Ig-like domain-containing protein n=1 Tax=Parastrongyloides trichosuri TaxID=131310 RepID=A0A0N5A686_PARTI
MPAQFNDGESIMEKMIDNDFQLVLKMAILYYKKSNSTFNNWSVHQIQKHHYPKCVRKVREDVGGELNFIPGVSMTKTEKVINDVNISVYQVPKSNFINGLPFECKLSSVPENQVFSTYFSSRYSTWVLYCGSTNKNSVIGLPLNAVNNGKFLLIPKQGDEYTLKESFNNRESATVQCEQSLSPIGKLTRMKVTEPNIEGRALTFCKRDSSNDFIYNGTYVNYVVKTQNNTEIICTYTTPIGTTFTIKKYLTLKA